MLHNPISLVRVGSRLRSTFSSSRTSFVKIQMSQTPVCSPFVVSSSSVSPNGFPLFVKRKCSSFQPESIGDTLSLALLLLSFLRFPFLFMVSSCSINPRKIKLVRTSNVNAFGGVPLFVLSFVHLAVYGPDRP